MSDGYKVYVSRDELEALKLEIMGDLDEIGDLIGGEDDGVYRINGFAYYEDMECYIAPIDSFPDVEAGICRITINGETVDGSVSRYTYEDGSGVVYITSNGTPKIWLMLMGGGDFSESEENFFGSFGTAQSLHPVEEVIELKFTKPEEMVDYAIYIESSYYEGSAQWFAFYDKDVFKNDKNATYEFEIYDGKGELMFKPNWDIESAVGYSEEMGKFVFSTNGIGKEEFSIIQDSINNNKPMTIICRQTLENGVVNTKTVSDVPVIRNDIIGREGQELYCWGNTDAFAMGG